MYVVTKRFGRAETRLSDFSKEQDAINFIYEKLREDIRFKVNATYGLYEGADILKEFKQSDVPDNHSGSSGPTGSDTSAQGGAGRGTSFNPTPFNTAPRPAGLPHNWVKDEDDKKE